MGCLQSVACKARVRREQIVVSDVSATIEPAATAIEESSPVVLRYRTPYFRASARVLMPPIARRHTWVVGWIQACNHMEFYNTYSDLGLKLGAARPARRKSKSHQRFGWGELPLVWKHHRNRDPGRAHEQDLQVLVQEAMGVIEPCPWRMLLSTQLEVEVETVPAGCEGLLQCPFLLGCRCPPGVPTYAFQIEARSPRAPSRARPYLLARPPGVSLFGSRWICCCQFLEMVRRAGTHECHYGEQTKPGILLPCGENRKERKAGFAECLKHK
ncbi:protein FAM78B isoform X2 [Empidonax traillii]|uniref:protein FAM78B isoform X2 n=1 Tax=Empidonax traillii TaxID=164674 RepID=UPI000FFD103F|nr:protein FAM78B isoform X2 [Empidonax traillii]